MHKVVVRILFVGFITHCPTPSFILIRSKIRHAAVVVHDVSVHVYEVRPRTDHRGVELNSDALPLGRLWYGEPDAISNAIDYAKFFSRSHDAVIRVYDEASNLIEMARARWRFQRVVNACP